MPVVSNQMIAASLTVDLVRVERRVVELREAAALADVQAATAHVLFVEALTYRNSLRDFVESNMGVA